jgi:hypothetical protein
MLAGMTERLTVSFDERVAARVRRCSARNGSASAYLAKLVRDDELREAGHQLAVWYATHPTFAEDSLAEMTAALDEAR